ncbi:MAG: hypothetical protein HOK82_08645, partial [Rhodospirillaceae bacterium]|nr:hypothetical protein [Rhodospirillaceae bacterium]
MKKIKVSTLAVTIALATWSMPASAVPISWNAGTADWFMAGNWTPMQVPTNLDDASVNNAGTANANGSVQVNELNIGRVTSAASATGTVNVTSGNLTGNGAGSLHVGLTDNQAPGILA